MSDHPALDRIEALVYELPGAENLDAHLRECPACAGAREQLRLERSLLEAALATRAMPPDLADRVVARLPAPRRRTSWGAWAAAAALLAVVLALWIHVDGLRSEVRTLRARLDAPAAEAKPWKEGMTLGIVGLELTRQQRLILGLPPEQGVVVVGIVQGSVIEKTLRRGDVIVKVNGKPVGTVDSLTTRVEEGMRRGGVSLAVRRGNEMMEINP